VSSATLLLFSIATIAPPGTDGAAGGDERLAPRSARSGGRHGGALLSDVLPIAATALGLGAVLAWSPTMLAVLKARRDVPALPGIGLLRSSIGAPSIAAPRAGTRTAVAASSNIHAALFRCSLLVALANPKGQLFISALLPQFIDLAAPQAAQYAALGCVFVAIDGAVTLGHALVGTRCLGRRGTRGSAGVNRACGAVLHALAGALAIAAR
jgi:homoserine/homoserine lactone efflux protein